PAEEKQRGENQEEISSWKKSMWISKVHEKSVEEKLHRGACCGEDTTCKSQLIMHERIQTGEKPYKYSEYGKSFLVVHGRTQTERRNTSAPNVVNTLVSMATLEDSYQIENI
uniref:C2H2-type domain-containing protein n=1 Tax=Naja naja TaxID=35670 RepID=A0A8C6XEQ6_NAJNA